MRQRNSSISDEIMVFQTHRPASKALEDLNLGIHYFENKHLKSHELYIFSPFVVTYDHLTQRAMGVKMQLIPVQKGFFRLVIEPSLTLKITNFLRSFISPLPEERQPIVYNKLHAFNEAIETPWFTITVQQLRQLKHDSYAFSILPNAFMAGFILNELSVAPSSKDGTIIVLSIKDNVALRAKDILNALSKAYIRENMEINSQSTADRW